MRTAILVDGDFYLRRHRSHFGSDKSKNPKSVVDNFWVHCIKHLDKQKDQLYRIYFYDCPPLDKKLHHPPTNKSIDLSKSPMAAFRKEFHKLVVQKRNVALRLGYLDGDNGIWRLRDAKVQKKVLSGKCDPKDLTENDFVYHANQKGVDMKIGLDIALLSHKKLVERVVLIAGDSDFVPAAKLARREGIEFILDPMRNHIRVDLQEHVDGLRTTLPYLSNGAKKALGQLS